MDAATVRRARLVSHRLSAPAPTIADAARHMLATQAQEFWGGRWALAARTRGNLRLSDVDAAFNRGEIVRSWTMRGTIHAIASEDLAWVLGITAERQIRAGAAVHRHEGIDGEVVSRAERAARQALRGGGQLTRAELFSVFEAAGVSVTGQRGYHLLTNLSMRQVLVQGPIVPRTGTPTREQHFVLFDEWIRSSRVPSDPLAEYFTRYIAAHGPAGARDFAWWSGLPLGTARTAALAAASALRVVDDVPEPQYVIAGPAPRRSPTAPEVVALPPFEEYYISYADRTVACAADFLRAVGPSKNGIVRPILLAQGQIVGVWTHSVAVGRHADDPVPELLADDAASAADIATALDRYRTFITG